jgi:hypothetical protein
MNLRVLRYPSKAISSQQSEGHDRRSIVHSGSIVLFSPGQSLFHVIGLSKACAVRLVEACEGSSKRKFLFAPLLRGQSSAPSNFAATPIGLRSKATGTMDRIFWTAAIVRSSISGCQNPGRCYEDIPFLRLVVLPGSSRWIQTDRQKVAK